MWVYQLKKDQINKKKTPTSSFTADEICALFKTSHWKAV